MLQAFVRVADLGSFSRAANHLESSRARVSQQIAALEKQLGARLLNRTTRRVTLTGDGEEYLERVRRVLADLALADEAVMHTRERPQGLLRVDVPVAFGRYLLLPSLKAFNARYPEVQLEVQLNDRIVDLVAERIDVAIRVGRVAAPGLIARKLVTLRTVTCASPAYLAANGTPRSVEDLARHRCIGDLSRQPGRAREWVFLQGGKKVRHRPRCHLAFNEVEAVLRAGIHDGGILQSVDLMAAEAIASGRLREVLPEAACAVTDLSVVYPLALKHAAKVRVFADFTTRCVQEWIQRRQP